MLRRDHSAPHDAYFAQLNALLRTQGRGQPALIVDLDRLDRNAARIKMQLNERHRLRLVAKSLPCTALIEYLQQRTGAQDLMVFDISSALELGALGAGGRMAYGKPMPVQAVDDYYRRAQPGIEPHWLIDSVSRLEQYDQWARSAGRESLTIWLEIDVGLHRGGLAIGEEFRAVLRALRGSRLRLTGLMGYEVHTASAASAGQSIEAEHARVCARYAAYVEQLRAGCPDLADPDLICNSGGSKTYHLHRRAPHVNDVALGSAFVKPVQDDLPWLSELEPAVYIAAPVLKVRPGTVIPYLEWARPLIEGWNPDRATSLFLFGGGWLADYASPAGLIPLPLMGFSTNQAHVSCGRHSGLAPDDYVFLRPTQSEKVLADLGEVLAVRGGQIVHRWDSW